MAEEAVDAASKSVDAAVAAAAASKVVAGDAAKAVAAAAAAVDVFLAADVDEHFREASPSKLR